MGLGRAVDVGQGRQKGIRVAVSRGMGEAFRVIRIQAVAVVMDVVAVGGDAGTHGGRGCGLGDNRVGNGAGGAEYCIGG